VTISGDLTGKVAPLQGSGAKGLFAVVAARVYDSAGTQIGRTSDTAIDSLPDGVSLPFHTTVRTSGTPAQCRLTFGASQYPTRSLG